MALPIGRVIHALRKKKGVRQNDLARLSGLKQPNLSRIENGLVEPRRATLQRIAEALSVTVEQLIDERAWNELGIMQELREAQSNLGGELPLRAVPLFSTAAGGAVDFSDGEHPVGTSDAYISVPGAPPACFATRIVGDSMESPDGVDSFREGDVAIFAEREVRPGDYAFVRTGDLSTFKQVFFDGDDVRLVPRNRTYEEKRVRRAEVVQMWRLIQHVKVYG